MGIFFETIRKPEAIKPDEETDTVKTAEQVIKAAQDQEAQEAATDTQLEMSEHRAKHVQALEAMGKTGHLFKSVSCDKTGDYDVKIFGQLNGHSVEVHDYFNKFNESNHRFSGTIDGKYQLRPEEIDSFLHRYANTTLDYDKEQELAKKVSEELDNERLEALKSIL